MRTAGEVLKKAREEKKLSLEEVEKVIKIRKKFLEALEENNFSQFSSYAVARGFLKNYAEYLGISLRSVLAFLKRDFIQAEKNSPGTSEKFRFKIKWSPKLTLLVLGVTCFLSVVFYLGWQYFSLRKAPFLEVFSPPEGEKTSSEILEISGKTHPEASLTINGVAVLLSSSGEFHYQLALFPGENKILIVAKSRNGKETKIMRRVFRLDNH